MKPIIAAFRAGVPLFALLLPAAFSPAVQAEAVAQLKTQAPGYYRLMVGQVEVTALYDGSSTFPLTLFKNATPDALAKDVTAVGADAPKVVNGSVNSFLINTGEHLILVDSGGGQLLGPGFGQVAKNLRAAGYRPEQVDTVLLTHMHGDHIGGLVNADGSDSYPNATVWASKAEADYWLSPTQAAKAPKEAQQGFERAQTILTPLRESGRFKTFTPGKELMPGLTTVALAGHTPGSSGYIMASGGQQMLFWGDVVHYAALQLPHPTLGIAYDAEGDRAVATRLALLKSAAADKTLIGSAHITFPGIGYVRADGKQGYSWTAVGFGEVR